MAKKNTVKDRFGAGSALILAVVLTSLLAVIGLMFLMAARVDKISTSAIAENKELNFAVDSVVAMISQQLVLDVPRTDSNGLKLSEYYDYPGSSDKWLANLEPYKDVNIYEWRQISDITGYLSGRSTNVQADIVPERKEITITNPINQLADADGDGVGDSKWIPLDKVTQGKGKTIYAAVRIVDNGGMINVNTAYKFDPNENDYRLIDGSSQMQINLFALAQRGTGNTINQIDNARFGTEPHNLDNYFKDVVWYYGNLKGAYTPFDIGDELKLRNRYLLNFNLMTSRIEELWSNVYDVGPRVPLPTISYPLSRWINCVNFNFSVPDDYDYRHISTIYNMDRIINPAGQKMLNINDANASSVYKAVRSGLIDANAHFPDANVNQVAAQIAVNLIDYVDADSNVTTFFSSGKTYYGFERPCIYLSEFACRIKQDTSDPAKFYRSYAVELYKPYSGDNDPCNWRLEIGGTSIPINNWTGNKQFYVIQDQNSNAILDVNSGTTIQNASFTFTVNTEISLQRPLPGGGYVTVDSYKVDPCLPAPWLSEDGLPHSIQRDITLHKCIRRLWSTSSQQPSLGYHDVANDYKQGDSIYIQAHPANEPFTNVGEIGMIFRKSAYATGPADKEEDVRVNLEDPHYCNLFKYLTVFDPKDHGQGANETRIKGRININTAPWYVIAQLPWVQSKIAADRYKLAQAIVAYRDKLSQPVDYNNVAPDKGRYDAIKNKIPRTVNQSDVRETPGFGSIGELALVLTGAKDDYSEYSIDKYAKDNSELTGFPDLTPNDGAIDDFEERDVIFARISNLVTVRSDVFTAYILVRIGTDGPQKRVIAILDRSDVYSGKDKVKVVALHPVPDPR